MNANELYELLKQAANYFGVGFHGMNQIAVCIREGSLVLSFGGNEIVTDINRRIEGEEE